VHGKFSANAAAHWCGFGAPNHDLHQTVERAQNLEIKNSGSIQCSRLLCLAGQA